MAEIEIPSFDWSAFYYAQILEALISFKRVYVPEHTDESPQDPMIQDLRAYACVGHLNNTVADVIANENTLPTAQLPENIRNMLRLIDYEMSSASPSQSDIVAKLVSALSVASLVINENAQISTRKTVTDAATVFEILSSLTAGPSDLGNISKVFAYDAGTDTYTDYTTKANSAPGDDFTPWGTPIQNNDALLIGQDDVLWNKLGAELDTGGDDYIAVWEYYDGNVLVAKPDTLERIGSTLRMTVTAALNSATNNLAGLTARVQLDKTGAFENVTVQYGDIGAGNVNYIVTSTLLGQSIAEADATSTSDYTAGSLWKELPDQLDGTNPSSVPLKQDGDLDFTLPETLSLHWLKVSIEGIEAYWMRLRIIINGGAATSPVIDRLRIDQGGQYVKTEAVQGQRQNDANLGTADGVTPSQIFISTKDGFVDNSQTVTVAGVEWTPVSNFLQSTPTDRHYQVVLGENDRASFKFGDGVRGAIPSGQVAAVYRHGVQTDGNVGANTIAVDKSGLTLVSSLWNPRPATGWQLAESATEASRELAKVQGPASLRAGEVALGPTDVQTKTLNYVDPETNSKPFVRSNVIEEGFGPKTMENVVVAAGGGAASLTQLDALDLYFNGDKYAHPPVPKRIGPNQELTSTNYSQKTISVTATVFDAVSLDAIEDALTALLHPEAKRADGVTFEWDFGGDVFLSRLNHEIFAADAEVTKVEDLEINGSPADEPLSERELPVAGTIVLTAG